MRFAKRRSKRPPNRALTLPLKNDQSSVHHFFLQISWFLPNRLDREVQPSIDRQKGLGSHKFIPYSSRSVCPTFLAKTFAITLPRKIWKSCPMSPGMLSRPWTAMSGVTYVMTVTATGADFWLDIMTTAIASTSGNRSNLPKKKSRISNDSGINNKHRNARTIVLTVIAARID